MRRKTEREGWKEGWDGGREREECWHSQHANVLKLSHPSLPIPSLHPPLCLSISLSIPQPLLHFTGAALEKRERDGRRGGEMRGREGYITGWSNAMSPFFPSLFSRPLEALPQCPKTKDAEKRAGDENRGKGRVSFFHPSNNGGMSCAYPLIITLLYSFPPSSPLSVTPHNPLSVRGSFSSRQSPSFFCHPSISLSFHSSHSAWLFSSRIVLFFVLFMILAAINSKLKVGRDKWSNYKGIHRNMAFFKNHSEQSASISWASSIFEDTKVTANGNCKSVEVTVQSLAKFPPLSLLPRSSVAACLRV